MATASNHLFEANRATAAAPATAVGSPRDAVAAGAGEAQAEFSDFPCSVAQERFWLLDRLEPGNPSYNVAVRWKLEGEVSSRLLEKAWREIISRHEILRTRFLEIDGKPIQRVHSQGSFRLSEIDLTSLPDAARSEEGDRIGLIEARAPFDLGSGPLIRVVLLRYSERAAIILVTTHQIVSDGWSIGVMAREMGTIYQSLAAGAGVALEPLPIQYGDYARWQLEWLRQRGISAETAYWTRQLSGVTPFEVVADRPRPLLPTTNGAIVSRVLPRELTNRVAALSAEYGVTLFATVVATLCSTLARYTGKSEIVIGTQVSDRDQVELEPMIGQFVNSLILRNDLTGDPRFAELLPRISTTISEALEHKHIPIERLLGMVKAGRGGSNSPPVSVNFIFQRTFIQNTRYGTFDLIDMPSLPAGAIYDLNFFMVERPDGWRFSVQFNTDQFEAATAERLLRYFQSALESAVAAPSRRISELRLADAAQINALLPRLSGPNEETTQSVGELISIQSRATPAAVAVQCDHRSLTFAALESEAERFSSLLQQKGVRPGDRVAIALPRSVEQIVALLGVWKSGAAWVDPGAALAAVGLETAVELSGAGFIVSERGIESADRSTPRAAGNHAAAVWFAFGEADAPIPIEIPHSSLTDVLTGARTRMNVATDDVFLSFGPTSAALFGIEVLLPLISGARSMLVAGDQIPSAEQLAAVLHPSQATTICATEGTCAAILGALPAGRKFRRLLCEDSIGPATTGRLLAAANEVWALHSHVETAGCASIRRIHQPHELRFLGEPLANVFYRVLDDGLKAPPLGCRGELYIGGHLGTADESSGSYSPRFIFAPSADGGDERLFRTGLAARVRADGVVEIIDERPRFEVLLPAETSDDVAGPVDPETVRRLTAIWADLLMRSPADIGQTMNFFELGGHSLLAARMLTRVQAEFGKRVTLASLFRAPTVRGLARLLITGSREFDFRQMVKLQADGANIPLIAINNTGVYYLLAKRLGPQQPVTSLQVFDPSARHDTLPQTLEEIAAEYVKLIRRVHPKGPYYLAGWCVAGALAFEIARQLAAGNQQVRNVFLIDSWVPGYFARLPLLRRIIGNYSLRWQLARADWRLYRSGQQTFAQFIEQRPSVRKLWTLWAGLSRRAGGRRPAEAQAGPEQYDRWLLEYLQATTNRYEPKPYAGRVTLFRSTQEPTGWMFDPYAGWGRFVQGGLELALIEGNHFTMFQDPGASQMAARMAPLITAE